MSTTDTSQAGSGKAALSVLFFLHAGAGALWIVPFANVMTANGRGGDVLWGLMMLSIARVLHFDLHIALSADRILTFTLTRTAAPEPDA